MKPFAAYVAVGGGSLETDRLADLADALFTYEPRTPYFIVVDDGRHGSRIRECVRPPAACELVVIPHPRTDTALNRHGALCTSNLLAMRYAYETANVDFLLKLDTDSLVIGPFADAVRGAFRARPNAGVIGVLGNSCNRSMCSFEADAALKTGLGEAFRIANEPGALSAGQRRTLEEWRLETDEHMASFRQACKLLAPLEACAFDGSHCQGGGFAVSEALLSRSSSAGFLEDPLLWTSLPFGEDKMMGSTCAAVGLQCADFSQTGEVFGIQATGLAYSPETLLKRGYSLIHSLKGDPRWPEDDIRAFFRERRKESARATPANSDGPLLSHQR